MKNKAAVALGKIKTKKAKAARINGALGGRPRNDLTPPKPHTLKKPCNFSGCKVTVNHEHV
jgi:hypothetical protein